MNVAMNRVQYGCLVSVKALSDVGTSLNTIVLGIYVLSVTGSSFALSIAVTSRLLATMLGSLLAARLNHLPRRNLIILSDFARVVVLMLLITFPNNLHSFLVFPVIAGIGFFSGLYRVMLYAEVPLILGFDQRVKVNSTFSAIEGGAEVIGGLSAAVILSFVSYKAVFLLDLFTYLISGVAMICIGFTDDRKRIPEQAPIQRKSLIAWDVILNSGISIALPLFILARGIEAFGSGVHNVGFPLFSASLFADNPSFVFGIIMAAWGMGRLTIAPIIPWLLLHQKVIRSAMSMEFIFLSAVIGTFLAFAGVFATSTLFIIAVLSFTAGTLDCLAEVTFTTALQKTPEKQRAAVIGVSYMFERAGLGLGTLCAGLLYQELPFFSVVKIIYGASILMILAILVYVIYYRNFDTSENKVK